MAATIRLEYDQRASLFDREVGALDAYDPPIGKRLHFQSQRQRRGRQI
jgi:hypothetical protein